MAAKTSPTSTPAGNGPAAGAALPWTWAADFGRQQLAVANEGAAVMARGMEAMRRIQEDAARKTGERHAAALAALHAGALPAQVLATQADLLLGNADAATRCWQELAAAALEMNTEMFGCAAHLVDTDAVFAAANGRLPQR